MKTDTQELTDTINVRFYNFWKDLVTSDITRFIQKRHTSIPCICTLKFFIEQFGKLNNLSIGLDNIGPKLLKASRLNITEQITE